MKSYFFTLFVRFFVAFSGLVVFVVSSKLYGAEGRGIIGYGTSIVSLFGLLLSFNLGRSFLFETKKNENLKQKLLPNFLTIIYLLMVVGVFTTAIFWFCNHNARSVIDSKTMMAFLILTPYYVWSVNGTTIYATLNKTTQQDTVIFVQRIVLIIITLIVFLLNVQSIKVFLYLYALILCVGTITEMSLLGNPKKDFAQLYNIRQYVSNSKYAHMDYLAFNLYPLCLMIVSGLFLKLSDLGNLNFLIQLINFIFILAAVASIRVKTYVSSKGMLYHSSPIKKLILFTLFMTAISVLAIFIFLKTDFFGEYFSTFKDLSALFLLISLALPGYIAYQFLYPVLIEYGQIYQSMKINLSIFIAIILITYPVLSLYGLVGGVVLFALFYLMILLGQIYLYKRLKLRIIRN